LLQPFALLFYGIDRALFAVSAHTFETHSAVHGGVQGIVAADTYVSAGMDVGASLTDKDVAGQNELTIGTLNAKALCLGVTTVLSGANALLVSEKLNTDIKHVLHLHYFNVIGIVVL